MEQKQLITIKILDHGNTHIACCGVAVPAQECLKSCGGRASNTSAQSEWFAKPEAQPPACLLNTWPGLPSTLILTTYWPREPASHKQTYLLWNWPQLWAQWQTQPYLPPTGGDII